MGISRIRFSIVAGLAATTIFAVVGLTTDNASASTCTPSGYYWSGSRTLSSENPIINTTIVIPAPGPTQELKINEIHYTVFDNSETSRLDPPQTNEQFGVFVGGAAVGGLSSDLPDGIDQEFSTGIQTGTIPTGGVFSNGGEIQIRHSSLYGAEGFDQFTAIAVAVDVVYCEEPAPTTVAETIPTVPPTAPATTALPTTTAVPTPTVATQPTPTVDTKVAEPAPTTLAPVVTTEPSVTSTTTNSGSGVSPLAVIKPAAAQAVRNDLPATGSQTDNAIILATVFIAIGLVLLLVRRRPANA